MLVLFNNKLKKTMSLALFLGTIFCCQAQHYDIKLFDGKLNSTKNQVNELTREYRQIQKEYQRYIKDRKKEYKQLADSVNSGSLRGFEHEFPKDSLRQLARSQEEYFVYTDSLYSLTEIAGWDQVKMEAKNRSASLIKSKLQGNEHLSRYEGLKHRVSSYARTIRIYRDSLKTIDTLERDEIRFLLSQKKKELSKEFEDRLESITRDVVAERVPKLPDGFQNTELADFQQANSYLMGGLNKDGLAKLSRAQSIDHFNGKQEVLENASNEVAELKKKFSEVTDSQDLSSARKNNTLKGSPVKKRMLYGGTFQLHVDEQTKIDLNPELGYRLNGKLEIGLGGTYRLMVETDDLPKAIDKPKVIGIRGFIEHKLIEQFYFHGEYESLKSSMLKDGENREGLWYSSFLAGIERRFVLSGKFQGQAQLLYNFSSRNNPLYRSPWVFRIGFNLSEKQ